MSCQHKRIHNFIELVKSQAQVARDFMTKKGFRRKVDEILIELSMLNDDLMKN